MESRELLVIGPQCALEYFHEGGANFIFRILPQFSGELPERLQGKLLRIRKDHPPLYKATKQRFDEYEENFKNLFPYDAIVEHELVRLDDGIIHLLNKALETADRPANRTQDTLPQDERYAVLVTDMAPRAGEALVQIKPKWLAQSPNAPVDARRCRTCALRAQRASMHAQTATDAQQYCPLLLVSDEIEDRQCVAECITSDPLLQQYLVRDLQVLLHEVKLQQLSLDRSGVMNAEDPDTISDLCKAMTLRDCTLLLKRSGTSVHARLVDLDLKSAHKLSSWRDVERCLTDGGWYTNHEDKRVWVKETVCMVSRPGYTQTTIASIGRYHLSVNNLEHLVAYRPSLSVVSKVNLPAGAHFCYITHHEPQRQASWRTIQTSVDTHTEMKSALLYLNHSCQPSLELRVFSPDADGRYPQSPEASTIAGVKYCGLVGELRVAKDRDLETGDELTFFYPSTEWHFDNVFDCSCKAPKGICIGKLAGAEVLDADVLRRYFVNEHIWTLCDARDQVSVATP